MNSYGVWCDGKRIYNSPSKKDCLAFASRSWRVWWDESTVHASFLEALESDVGCSHSTGEPSFIARPGSMTVKLDYAYERS